MGLLRKARCVGMCRWLSQRRRCVPPGVLCVAWLQDDFVARYGRWVTAVGEVYPSEGLDHSLDDVKALFKAVRLPGTTG